VANQAKNKEYDKDKGEESGDGRKVSGKTAKSQKSRKYCQQEESDDIVQHWYSPYVLGLFPDWLAKVDIAFLGQATSSSTDSTTYYGTRHRIAAKKGTAYGADTGTDSATTQCAFAWAITTCGQ
jgi:hypothetical protein